MPEHKYAAILRAIADGKKIQFRWKETAPWADQDAFTTLVEIANDDYVADHYRIKPEIITINGIEVPKPVKEPLEDGTRYFYPRLDRVLGGADLYSWSGSGDPTDRRLLERGLVHLTRGAAEIHAKALISFTEQPCQN